VLIVVFGNIFDEQQKRNRNAHKVQNLGTRAVIDFIAIAIAIATWRIRTILRRFVIGEEHLKDDNEDHNYVVEHSLEQLIFRPREAAHPWLLRRRGVRRNARGPHAVQRAGFWRLAV